MGANDGAMEECNEVDSPDRHCEERSDEAIQNGDAVSIASLRSQ
jgi:hypothetical protein